MFARASLVALALASPAWADPDYPAGLFERSPLNGLPAAVSHRGHKIAPSQAKDPASERASGASDQDAPLCPALGNGRDRCWPGRARAPPAGRYAFEIHPGGRLRDPPGCGLAAAVTATG